MVPGRRHNRGCACASIDLAERQGIVPGEVAAGDTSVAGRLDNERQQDDARRLIAALSPWRREVGCGHQQHVVCVLLVSRGRGPIPSPYSAEVDRRPRQIAVSAQHSARPSLLYRADPWS